MRGGVSVRPFWKSGTWDHNKPKQSTDAKSQWVVAGGLMEHGPLKQAHDHSYDIDDPLPLLPIPS